MTLSHHVVTLIACLSIAPFTQAQNSVQTLVPVEKAPVALGDAVTVDAEQLEKLSAPPKLPKSKAEPKARALDAGTPTSGFSIDATNRNDVAAGYHAFFTPSEGYAAIHGFTGDVQNCIPGTLSDLFQDMTLLRVNYYRAQAGLPADIYFTAAKNEKSQKAAVMMAHLDTITHYPAIDYPGDACVIADLAAGGDGVAAAASSNLSLGTFGPRSIDGQMTDDGSNNTIVGHRRWILYSKAQEMGNGATPSNGTYPYDLPEHPKIDCLWVIGDFKPAPTPQAVPWPNEGYVPWDLAPNDGESYPRWSYSYPGANFNSATVTMTQGGTSITLLQEPVTNGAGDNTIVWRPTGIPDSAPNSDTTYTVSISGIIGAPFANTSYNVTLIDPYTLNDMPSVTGPANPTNGVATSYDFTSVDQAEAYQARITEVAAGTWAEGAEVSPSPAVIDNTGASYELLSSAYSATGAKAFHLATPSFSSSDSFTVDRTIVPQAGSHIQFQYRRFFMTSITKLYVEISDNDGASFTPIYNLSGQATNSSAQWDANFLSASIPIPASYQDKPIQLRFRIDPQNSAFIGSSNTNGLYIDDISVSNSLELTAPSTVALTAGDSSFSFTPSSADQTYLLQVRPQLGGHWFGYGDTLSVTSTDVSPPVITSPASATGTQGAVFSYTITATNSPTSFGATGLPTGAAINTATGTITGNIAPGVYGGTTLSASNAGGTDTAPLSIEITTGYAATVAESYPGLGAPLEDDDLDGILNIVELSISGMNPTIPDAHLLPQASLSGGNLVLIVEKSQMPGIDYAIVGSDTLLPASWSSDDLTIVTDDANTLSVSYPISSALKYFLRLVIAQNSDTTTSP